MVSLIDWKKEGIFYGFIDYFDIPKICNLGYKKDCGFFMIRINLATYIKREVCVKFMKDKNVIPLLSTNLSSTLFCLENDSYYIYIYTRVNDNTTIGIKQVLSNVGMTNLIIDTESEMRTESSIGISYTNNFSDIIVI